VVEFQPPNIVEAMRLYFSLLSADGSHDARQLLRGSPRDRRIARLIMLARLPSAARWVISRLLDGLGHRHAARLLRHTGPQSAASYWELCRQRTVYAAAYWNAAREARIDAFLLPPFGLPAILHGNSAESLPAGSYAFLMNLLDAPAGVVPMTQVRVDETNGSRNRHDYIERFAAQSEAGSEGLPVGVQIASWPWREDIVLRLMEVLESAKGAT